MFTQSLKSASQLSRAIRAKKKKIAMADPEIVDTSPTPDMNAQDVWDMEKKGQYEDTIDSPEKINADKTAMDEPYVQEPMSKEPMKSKEMPSDHGKMAYGGMAEEHEDPSMPSMEMARDIAGSSGTKSEMNQRIGEGFQSGIGEGSRSTEGGPGVESEEKRRIGMRKQRLSSYLDGLDRY